MSRSRRPLLESLVNDHLDPGYAAAARRTAGAPPDRSSRRRAAALVAVTVLVVGAIFGIAAGVRRDSALGARATREALIGDIEQAQSRQGQLAALATSLGSEIRSSQAALGAAGPLQKVQSLAVQGAQTAVTGPGLTVLIDGPPVGVTAGPSQVIAPPTAVRGAILDRDIQLLVNGLWSAGAEAISIGGIRLRTTSAIRQAGGAILVDNRPVFWPITINAVGSPSAMHVNFVGTTGFGRLSSLASLYGIRFDITDAPQLMLPAGPAPDLRFAAAPSGVPTTARSDLPRTAPSGVPTTK